MTAHSFALADAYFWGLFHSKVGAGLDFFVWAAGSFSSKVQWRGKRISGEGKLTRMGGFLRRWSLDELPQLLNVLKGEMSLVRPRPYVPRELDGIGPDLHTILSARPGMTGFWQVSGRNQLSFEDRVKFEAWYVRNWTVWLDCIVFVKTFGVVLFPENGCRRQDVDSSAPVSLEDTAAIAVPADLAAAPGKSRRHSAGL